MTTLRYLEKFENILASLTYTFPLRNYEWTSEQEARIPLGTVAGANYAYDFLGTTPSPLQPARETVRCLAKSATWAALETEIDNAKSICHRIGLGKLYVLNQDGSRRWAYGRLTAVPSVTVASPQGMFVPMVFEFIRLSDWFSTTATTGSQLINATPTTVVVNNPGNVPADFAVFRLRSNGATGFTNPAILNLTNSYSISSTRDATSVDSELKFDCEKMEVKYSVNDGASYTDDWANASIGATQVGIMRLEPGNNSLRYTDGGTPNLNLEWSFYAPYR